MFTHTYHSVTLEMIRLSHVCACVFKLRVSAHTTQIFDCPTGTNTHYAHMYVYININYIYIYILYICVCLYYSLSKSISIYICVRLYRGISTIDYWRSTIDDRRSIIDYRLYNISTIDYRIPKHFETTKLNQNYETTVLKQEFWCKKFEVRILK